MSNLPDGEGFTRDMQRMRAAGARIVLVAGLVASEVLTFSVGHRNHSQVLMLLFVVWVGSPYFGLWRLAGPRRWSNRSRSAIDWSSLVLVVLTLAIYARVAFGPSLAKPALPFLVVPLAMWIFIAILARLASRPR